MVTFEEAKEIALQAHSGFDRYAELRDAYIFLEEPEPFSIGGYEQAVVMKGTGEIFDFPWYQHITKEEYEVLSSGRL